jgi:hypothetical protein
MPRAGSIGPTQYDDEGILERPLCCWLQDKIWWGNDSCQHRHSAGLFGSAFCRSRHYVDHPDSRFIVSLIG